LVSEIVPKVSKPLINVADFLGGFLSLWRSFRQLGFFTLLSGKPLFTFSEISLVLYESSIREYSKVGYTNVYTYRFLGFR